MKNVLFATIIAFSGLAKAAETITYTDLIIKKDEKNQLNQTFTGYLSMKHWCLKEGGGMPIELMTFQVAKDVEKMEDGIYKCQGQFSKLFYQNIKAYQFEKCIAVTRADLNRDCP